MSVDRYIWELLNKHQRETGEWEANERIPPQRLIRRQFSFDRETMTSFRWPWNDIDG